MTATKPEYAKILTAEAIEFLTSLHRAFEGQRQNLLQARVERQKRLEAGEPLHFLPHTADIRGDASWKGPGQPAPGLEDRRVEITGPVDRKTVINALNSGATQYMADFEDSNSPTWTNCMDGQVNLYDATRRTITFQSGQKDYRLVERPAVLLVRPRGWHLVEGHFLVDGQPISASLFDFGLYFWHNARETLKIGHGPYFYLPKMEGHLEARLWNRVFIHAQQALGLPIGTVRATVLIETITAAFEMDEIIYELRQHSAGLNCGRWDYIFSVIKKFHRNPAFILPDRAAVTMTAPFMQAYVDLLIQTCHRRGVHAMGGMAAQIPIKDDAQANEAAMAKVRADKLREVQAGHDGTWVAHPALIPIAKAIFDQHMPGPNQIDRKINGRFITEAALVEIPKGPITEAGIRGNVSAALQYMEAWLRGVGCVPINHLMEDAATAEIARSQLWQWIHHKCKTTDTQQPITLGLVESIIDQECAGQEAKYAKARHYLLEIVGNCQFTEFLTLICYPEIITMGSSSSSKL